jgi:adenylyltransferase/sulfurtransferase
MDGGRDPERYSRQIRFAAIGPHGQERLARARVLLVGVGALGTHLADHLVRAGVGRLWLVDRDVVELHNLQRQTLFTEADARAAAPKARAAARALAAVDAEVRLDPVVADFDAGTFAELDARPDLLLDGTDNFATRYLLNDLAHRERLPWIYGGVLGGAGSAAVVLPGRTPCLRCRVPDAPAAAEAGSCETEGVLGPAVAMVAAFQAAQALKLLAGAERDVADGVFALDVWRDEYGLRLRGGRPDPACPCCGAGRHPALEQPPPRAVALCGRNAVQVRPRPGTRIDLAAAARTLAKAATGLEQGGGQLRFELEGVAVTLFPGGRALVHGTGDVERARVLYDRYLGG